VDRVAEEGGGLVDSKSCSIGESRQALRLVYRLTDP
jgi:hypothetical protein